MSEVTPIRKQISFGNLFGWYHIPEANLWKNCTVVLCYPVGYEYTHAYRSIRELADTLAKLGFPTLRFDYLGQGDSGGESFEPNLIEHWKQNILDAATFARAQSKCENICLVGIRLGATLAGLVSEQASVDTLVLWNPVISGKRYLRELDAMNATSTLGDTKTHEYYEAVGLVLHSAAANSLRQLDLLQEPIVAKQAVLLIERDDQTSNQKFLEKLKSAAPNVEQVILPGFLTMMAEPHFTKIPQQVFDYLGAWLVKKYSDRNAPDLAPQLPAKNIVESAFQESPHLFSRDPSLFGVLCEPEKCIEQKPILVFINGGSVTRVGPNRLYVFLARSFARMGYRSFRFDLRGLGDTGQVVWPDENHPYPASATDDIKRSLEFLSQKFEGKKFILIGLCSGAHHAFHAAISLKQFNLSKAILFNPITFHWKTGMSLGRPAYHSEARYYKRALVQKSAWKKLLKGKVNLLYALRFLLRLLLRKTVVHLHRWKSTPMMKDLKILFSLNRSIAIFASSTESSREVLMQEGRGLAKQGIETKSIEIFPISKSDHTFSTKRARDELFESLSKYIKSLS